MWPTPSVEPMVAGGIEWPAMEVKHNSTTLTVEQVLKNDGSVRVGGVVKYSSLGSLPSTRAEAVADASSEFPEVWNVGARFVLFLDKDTPESMIGLPPDLTPYFVASVSACGRILDRAYDGETGVSCSNASRTVLPFMEGLSFSDFVDAVSAEVAAQSTPVQPSR